MKKRKKIKVSGSNSYEILRKDKKSKSDENAKSNKRKIEELQKLNHPETIRMSQQSKVTNMQTKISGTIHSTEMGDSIESDFGFDVLHQ